jgi:hypothetical protein
LAEFSGVMVWDVDCVSVVGPQSTGATDWAASEAELEIPMANTPRARAKRDCLIVNTLHRGRNENKVMGPILQRKPADEAVADAAPKILTGD